MIITNGAEDSQNELLTSELGAWEAIKVIRAITQIGMNNRMNTILTISAAVFIFILNF